MKRTRGIMLSGLVACAAVTAKAGDAADARANAGRPLCVPAAEAPTRDGASTVSRETDRNVVDQWAALATRVSPDSQAPELEERRSRMTPSDKSTNGMVGESTKPLARHNGERSEGITSPLDGFGGPTKSFWPLGATLGAIILAGLLARRWMPGQGRMGGVRVIQVLARHSLSSKQSLCLVRLGEGLVLLGVTPERIAALVEIHDGEQISRIIGAARSGQRESFSGAFRRLTELPALHGATEEVPEAGSGFAVSSVTSAASSMRELMSRVRELSAGPAAAEPA